MTADARATPAPRPAVARSLLAALRPRHWVKNILVAAAPAGAGVLNEGDVVLATVAAFVAFCLAASGTYLLNDVLDADGDRLHPTKRRRGVASGTLPASLAATVGTGALVIGVVVAALVNRELAAVVAGYAALMTAYSLLLKRFAVLDIAVVAIGFFLRPVAGGVAVDVPISRWFLIVTAFASLYVVTAKRYAELGAFGGRAPQTRPSLESYSQEYLRTLMAMSGAVSILGFCLWAFEGSEHNDPSVWAGLSVIPFVLGIMRYGLLVERGAGDEPEEIFFHDRQLQFIGLAWIALVAIGISS